MTHDVTHDCAQDTERGQGPDPVMAAVKGITSKLESLQTDISSMKALPDEAGSDAGGGQAAGGRYGMDTRSRVPYALTSAITKLDAKMDLLQGAFQRERAAVDQADGRMRAQQDISEMRGNVAQMEGLAEHLESRLTRTLAARLDAGLGSELEQVGVGGSHLWQAGYRRLPFMAGGLEGGEGPNRADAKGYSIPERRWGRVEEGPGVAVARIHA